MISTMYPERKKKKSFALWAVVFWLLVWEAIARWVDQSLLLVSPLTAAHRLVQLLVTAPFWQSAAYSLGHIFLGFLLSALLGIGLAICSYRFYRVEQLLSPITAAVKAIPVASFVILALLWVSKQNLSVLISLLIGFPVIYGNALTGLKSTDPQLIEMAKLFKTPFLRQLRALYLPSLAPYLKSGLNTAVGLCWKSGVAAEVIGTPKGSMGERLYNAKIYLETPDLFAWTLAIVLLSILCEKLVGWLLVLAQKKLTADSGRFAAKKSRRAKDFPCETSGGEMHLHNISHAYDGKPVLENLSLSMLPGGKYCFVGKSGSGKTTLLRIMMGLLRPTKGSAADFTQKKPSAVFQEDRLLGWMNAAQNLRFVSDIAPEEAEELLLSLGLEKESLSQPVSEYSGGMQRRVAIARALSVPFEVLYLDEPFKGLDAQTLQQVEKVIKERTAGKTVVLVTHDLRQAEGYELISLRAGDEAPESVQ